MMDPWIAVTGEWTGTKRLWLSPDEEPHESASTGTVAGIVQGQFVRLSYTWAFEGEDQDGLIVFPLDLSEDPSKAVWLDSWHMGEEMMICEGRSGAAGAVSLRGSYAAPPGRDWGWRIEIDASAEDALVIRMTNISPEGEESQAVLAEYTRSEGG